MASPELKKSVRRRKNFLLPLLVALFSWSLWLWLFLAVPPNPWAFLFFFLTLFLALFLSAALVLANSLRGFLLASAGAAILLLQFFKLGNPVTFGLLFGLLVVLYLRFARE